jgi:hypothetical protein
MRATEAREAGRHADSPPAHPATPDRSTLKDKYPQDNSLPRGMCPDAPASSNSAPKAAPTSGRHHQAQHAPSAAAQPDPARLAGIRLAVYSAADAHGPQADIKGFGFPGGWRPRDESLSLDGLPERLRQVGAVPFGAARHAQYDEGRRFAADKFGAQLLELDARPDEVHRVCVHARRGPARQATAPGSSSLPRGRILPAPAAAPSSLARRRDCVSTRQ